MKIGVAFVEEKKMGVLTEHDEAALVADEAERDEVSRSIAFSKKTTLKTS